MGQSWASSALSQGLDKRDYAMLVLWTPNVHRALWALNVDGLNSSCPYPEQLGHASYHFHSCQVAHVKWAWPGPATFDVIDRKSVV